jgi:putative flippase GtrA
MESIRDTAFQFWWFGCVGMVNTFLDLALFNLLTRPPAAWRRVPASLASTSAGMAFGFSMNFLIFQPQRADLFARAFRFLGVNFFSCYVIQSAVILLGTHFSPHTFQRVIPWIHQLPGGRGLGHDFIEKNLIKATAILAGLLWNFSWYKWYVYAG